MTVRELLNCLGIPRGRIESAVLAMSHDMLEKEVVIEVFDDSGHKTGVATIKDVIETEDGKVTLYP